MGLWAPLSLGLGAHLVETWDGSTESKVVGAEMHALVGAGPASRAPDVAVPHLSPAALSAGQSVAQTQRIGQTGARRLRQVASTNR